MPQTLNNAKKILGSILENHDEQSFAKTLSPVSVKDRPLPSRIPVGNNISTHGLTLRQQFIRDQGIRVRHICGTEPPYAPEYLQGNIENHIGYASIPVGVIGPLRINGLNANGDFFVPMATTEGALIASYHRGAYVISQSGGTSTLCITEGISRAPCFVFDDIRDCSLFTAWVLSQSDGFQQIIDTTTRHGKLEDIDTVINGRNVFLIFRYTTGDAAGQNMVTVATDAVCQSIVKNSPIKPLKWFLEGNLSGDKKITMISFLRSRGKKVVADVTIPSKLVKRFLNTTPADMELYCHLSTQGGIQSGSIGVQGHYANALAALFICCGQDAACVSEASSGVTDMYVTGNNDLYVSVSLPNLTVGTVGGGTHLPTARECLEMMDCYGTGKARKFAEICAATVLAGEISIIGALAAGDFGDAHARFRHKSSPEKGR